MNQETFILNAVVVYLRLKNTRIENEGFLIYIYQIKDMSTLSAVGVL